MNNNTKLTPAARIAVIVGVTALILGLLAWLWVGDYRLAVTGSAITGLALIVAAAWEA